VVLSNHGLPLLSDGSSVIDRPDCRVHDSVTKQMACHMVAKRFVHDNTIANGVTALSQSMISKPIFRNKARARVAQEHRAGFEVAFICLL
jgi:hypothetical protein